MAHTCVHHDAGSMYLGSGSASRSRRCPSGGRGTHGAASPGRGFSKPASRRRRCFCAPIKAKASAHEVATLGGDSGLKVSRVCLGTMQYGEGLSWEEGFQQMSYAKERGVTFFDSAEMYPVPQRAETQGSSEQCLGRWISKSGVARDSVQIATKVTGPSAQMTWIRDGPGCINATAITDAVEGSLSRLNTDYIDLLQLHWPDRYVPMFGEIDFDPTYDYDFFVPVEEQLEALGRLVRDGKVREVGLSNETPWGVMQFAHQAHTNAAWPRVVSIQNAYNLLCRHFDSTLAECCHREKVSLLAYSPLAMGHLSGKYLGAEDTPAGPPEARLNRYKGRYAEAESRYSFTRPNLMPAVRAYSDLAALHGISLVHLATRFVLDHPLVGSAVVGATSIQQLGELLDAAEAPPLGDEILKEITRVHKRYPNPAP